VIIRFPSRHGGCRAGVSEWRRDASQALRCIAQEGVRLLREGDAKGAVQAFTLQVDYLASRGLAVPAVVLNNRAAALVAANCPQAAVQDALAALRTIESAAAG
jgi:hypothetical protein